MVFNKRQGWSGTWNTIQTTQYALYAITDSLAENDRQQPVVFRTSNYLSS